MAGIYESSFVTISANNSTGILLGSDARSEARTTRVQAAAADENEGLFNFIVRRPLEHDKFFASSLEGVGLRWEKDYPLSKRAWCFQERLLATRILHFTSDEVVFECKTHCECECGSISHSGATTVKTLYAGCTQKNFTCENNAWKTPLEGWQSIVSPYIQKDITYPTDIFPALSGIASRMQCDELGQYTAGLWKKELAQSLFWFADIVALRDTSIKTAPSFSWASLAGTTSKVKELQWPWTPSPAKQIFSILEIRCHVQELSPYGSVSDDAFIRVHGYILNVSLQHAHFYPGLRSLMQSQSSKKEQIIKAFYDRYLIGKMETKRDFVCLLGFTWLEPAYMNPSSSARRQSMASALILESVGGSSGLFMRAGCIPNLENVAMWLEDARQAVVTII